MIIRLIVIVGYVDNVEKYKKIKEFMDLKEKKASC